MKRWMIALLLSLVLAPGPAWSCPGRELPTSEPIKEEPLGESGLTIYYYDTDGDGQADRALVYGEDVPGHLESFPLFYFEGLDPVTGLAEEVWIDRGEDGLCQNIKLYYKRHVRL